jgi:hypothetical protein
MSLLSSAIEFAMSLAQRALKLTHVVLPPKLEGPIHVYGSDPNSSDYYHCLLCGRFSSSRAAYTTPACSQRLPTPTELP